MAGKLIKLDIELAVISGFIMSGENTVCYGILLCILFG
jgi:hypothetical protein